jgi:hypothetical protein
VPRITPADVPIADNVGESDALVAACPDIGPDPGALASPKSRTLTLPPGVRRTLAGLRSRWMTPDAWAASRASAIWIAIRIASSTGSAPRLRRCDRSSPSTSSIARKRAFDAS